MKLTGKKRADASKGANKAMRREGNIPAVLYAPGQSAESIEIKGEEFAAALRSIKKGTLSTKVFELDIDGKKVKAIVKDIQYHRTTYRIEHLDFEELKDDVMVKVKVPVQCIGMDRCEGIKLGGVLRQVIRQVQVKCLPKDIPAEFELDIHELKMKQSKKMSDIVMPSGVEAVSASNEVIALIAKR